ncbi:hypothetical protein SMD11_6948 [Streptomyces albireticuli]|uniref:Squalene cyclase C-terminal domain-containing protein n=1 Tax=Streptomyces albireticuli TaxID=1940 RepID=A0A1Z2LDZ3_9ACTN|nr:hypothetical protein [Streptomyces albireticuli]ARZ72524.1 hypothetical protein SMD11_6948 [Streptomyces albireticuli]
MASAPETERDRRGDLSISWYDVAMVALVDGPQRAACLDWLAGQRRQNGAWGAEGTVSWHDTYVATYAAAVAFHAAGHVTIAEEAVNALSGIRTDTPGCETLTFGGLVDTLDRIATFAGRQTPHHPDQVTRLIHEERAKWEKMCAWEFRYDPELSIAGYCAERLFGSDHLDLVRVVESFQTGNGSISNSPGASAGVLLEARRRGTRIAPLRLRRLTDYIATRRPETIGYLDHVPHFGTAWTVMFAAEAGLIDAVMAARTRSMLKELADSYGLLCPVGPATIPGDPDTSACALTAAAATGQPVFGLPAAELLYDEDKGCYRTYFFERDGSVSTNIHMAGLLGLLGEHDRLGPVLNWLLDRLTDGAGYRCKWHSSPVYALGETARVTAKLDHPTARRLGEVARARLRQLQNADGGWGARQSTVEETGYAVLGLAADPHETDHALLKRAAGFLSGAEPDYRPLWIGKSLYCVNPLVPVLQRTALARIEQLALL